MTTMQFSFVSVCVDGVSNKDKFVAVYGVTENDFLFHVGAQLQITWLS